jgi:hypothetical protein
MSEQEKVYDEYLMEVYKQACENARMYATSRFSNLSAFLTYMSVLTAAIALIYSSKSPLPIFKNAIFLIAGLGIIVSLLFFALEIRHHNWWKYYELDKVKEFEKIMGYTQYPDDTHKRNFVKKGIPGISATKATYGIYLSSMLFFITIIVSMAIFGVNK